MKKLFIITLTVLFSIFTNTSNAQNVNQTIKGTVLEKSIKGPMLGANVIVLNTNPLQGATVDENSVQ